MNILSRKNNSRNIVCKLRHRRINSKPHVNYGLHSRLPSNCFAQLQLQKIVRGHAESISCIIFDNTGQYVFTASAEKFIKVWLTTTAQLLFTFRGHEEVVSALAINQENTLLASGSHDKTVRIWNLNSGSCVSCLYGADDIITKIRFHPSNGTSVYRFVVATTKDSGLISWRYRDRKDAWLFVSTKHPYSIMDQSNETFSCASFSASGSYLAAVSTPNHTIVIYALYSDLLETVFREPTTISHQVIQDLQFSHNDTRFVSVALQGILTLWCPNNKFSKWKKLPLHNAHKVNDSCDVYAQQGSFIRWSIDNKYIVIIGNKGKIGVWNSTTRRLAHVLDPKNQAFDIDTIEVHPKNPEILMSLDSTSFIKIWNIETGQQIACYNNDQSLKPILLKCLFSPHGQMFASVDIKGYLYLYGIGSNQLYDKVPTEMFFSTDYHRVFMLDNSNGTFVMDEYKSVAPSLMPKPRLVDFCGHPYADIFQQLVPERNQPILTPMSNFLLNLSYGTVQNLIESEKVNVRDHFPTQEIQAIDEFRQNDGENLIDGEIVCLRNSEMDYIIDVE